MRFRASIAEISSSTGASLLRMGWGGGARGAPWNSKPMVYQTYGFQPGGLHENDGNHENERNDADNSESQTATNKRVKYWIYKQTSRKPQR